MNIEEIIGMQEKIKNITIVDMKDFLFKEELTNLFVLISEIFSMVKMKHKGGLQTYQDYQTIKNARKKVFEDEKK